MGRSCASGAERGGWSDERNRDGVDPGAPGFGVRWRDSMTWDPRGSRAVAAIAVFVGSTSTARADESRPRPNVVRTDLGLGLSLRRDDGRDGAGFAWAAEYERRLHPLLGVGVRLDGAVFPYDEELYDGNGRAGFLGLGPVVRLHMLPSLTFGDLWFSASPELVITGDLARFGVEAGAGFDVSLPHDLSIGPFVRYTHVLQGNEAPQGSADGRVLTFGATLGFAFGQREESEPEPTPQPEPEPTPEPEPQPTPEPEPLPELDSDADGVPDSRDACVDTAAATADGCPLPDSDRDGDGVLDLDDACPAIPGVESTGGCPLAPPPSDRDRDGFPDADDACPDVPAASSDRGCPPPTVRALDVTIRFHTGSATPTHESLTHLRDALRRLRAEPTIRISIEGHADHLGEQARNGELSLERARYIHAWLIQHGVAEDRLELRGAGSHTPLVQGANPGDLAPNRRVELHILD